MSDAADNSSAPAGSASRRRRLRYGLTALLVLMLLLAVIAGRVLSDQERLRHLAENILSGIGDRPFVIAGDFRVGFGRVITLQADGISWANADWSDAPAMLTIDSIEATIDARQLFNLQANIISVTARGTELLLEWNNGRFNWKLIEGRKDSGQREALPVFLQRAELRDSRVRVRHPALQEELALTIPTLSHTEDAAHRLVLNAEAILDGKPLTIAGQIGPFPELIVAGATDFELRVDGEFATLDGRGAFSRLATLADPAIAVTLSSEQTGAWLQALQLPAGIDGATRLELQINAGDDSLAASLTGNAGPHALDARLQIPDRDSLDGFQLQVDADGPSFGGAAATAGLGGLPEVPYRLDIRAQQTANGLELQQLTLDTKALTIQGTGVAHRLPELRDIDLTLTASGTDLATTATMLGVAVPVQQPFLLNADVQSNGADQNDTLTGEFTVGRNSVQVTAELTETTDFAGSRFTLTAAAPQAQELAPAVRLQLPAGTRADATAQGNVSSDRIDLTALTLNLNGNRFMGNATIGRSAELPALTLQGAATGGDLAALLALLAPAAAQAPVPPDPYTLTTTLTLRAGKLNLAPARVELPGGTVGFDGDIDLSAGAVTVDGKVTGMGDNLGALLRTLDADLLPLQRFTLRTGLRVAPERVELRALDLQTPRAQLSGDVSLRGAGLDAIAFDITMSGEDFAAVVPDNEFYEPAAQPFRLAGKGEFADALVRLNKLTGQIGSIDLSASGELQSAPVIAASNVSLRAGGKRLSDIGTIMGWQPSELPFELRAALAGSGDRVSADDLLVRVGTSELRGKLRYAAAERPFIGVKLESESFDLRELAAARRAAGNDDGEIAEDSTTDLRTLFNDAPLPFDTLRKFDGELDLRIARLQSERLDVSNLLARASLDSGNLEIGNISGELRRGRLRADGALRPDPAGWALQANVEAQEALLPFAGMSEQVIATLPRYAADIRIASRGNTTRQLAANTNGFAWVIGGPGRLPETALTTLTGDFLTELLRTVNPFAKDRKFLQEDCLGIFMEIENGLLQTSPAMVNQNDSVSVVAMGRINLVSEKIDFTFETTPRKGVGISISDLVNPFTKVVGTLTAPKITLDPAGTMVEGGAAVATGGMTLLAKSLWKRWVGSKQICRKIAEQAVEKRRSRDPENVPDISAMWMAAQQPEE